MKKIKKFKSVSLGFHQIILNDKTLTTTERFLLALINFRDQPPRGCFSSNAELGRFLNCSSTTISKTVASLTTKGYIIFNKPDEENGGRVNIRKVKQSLKKRATD
jgi:DNA-binding MarR family transcriptional regulator